MSLQPAGQHSSDRSGAELRNFEKEQQLNAPRHRRPTQPPRHAHLADDKQHGFGAPPSERSFFHELEFGRVNWPGSNMNWPIDSRADLRITILLASPARISATEPRLLSAKTKREIGALVPLPALSSMCSNCCFTCDGALHASQFDNQRRAANERFINTTRSASPDRGPFGVRRLAFAPSRSVGLSMLRNEPRFRVSDRRSATGSSSAQHRIIASKFFPSAVSKRDSRP